MHVWIGGWFGLSLGLLGLLPTVLHTSFYIVCHFLLFQLHSAEAIEAVCLARLVWPGGLFSLQPRRVKRELLSLACKKAAAVAPTAADADAAPPAFFFFLERETLYIPSH